MAQKLGIDLGTTYSAIAHPKDGEPEMIKNHDDEYTLPSVVQIREDGKIIGKRAKNSSISYAQRTLEHIKRHMGDENWETPEIDGQSYSPQQVSAFILESLVADAEERLDDDVNGVVITVPAYFGVAQREATRDAAKIANLEVERLINEPTAACLRYAHEQQGKDNFLHGEEELVFVYDLGGGTFDSTLVEVGDQSVRVVGTDGDQQLGGEDFDNEIYQYFREELIEDGHDDPSNNPKVEANLREEARKTKEDLSTLSETETSMFLPGGEVLIEIKRDEKFHDLIEHFVNDTFQVVEGLFDDKKVDRGIDEVDRVLLVGGSTRIPLIQERVEEYFGIEPSKELDPDHVVAEGAAIQAGNLNINLEEQKEGGEGETKLVDVISHTVGIEVDPDSDDPDAPNEREPLLEKNETVPHEESKLFTTTKDEQEVVEVRILEGESPLADDNTKLGKFRLKEIPPAPAGEPNIEVIFYVNEEGTIEATAEHEETGKSANATVDVGLDTDEIEERREEIASVPMLNADVPTRG